MSLGEVYRSHGLTNMSSRFKRLEIVLHTSKLVEANLNFKGSVSLLLVDLKIFVSNERNLLIRGLGTENIPQ
jgi:hypothetical protein